MPENAGTDDYFLCKTADCDVVYYNSKSVFYKHDVIVPIWFKDGADPKYICYCNKVTEEQIVDAVVSRNARNMKDIIELTGAMKNGKCELNNPAGKCCGPVIKQTIEKAMTGEKATVTV